MVLAPCAGAQQRHSAEAGVKPQPVESGPAVAPREAKAPRVDTIKGSPIPPGRAFLYSLLVPGLGQAKLDRAWTGALFGSIEILAISRLRQAQLDLSYAQKHHSDSVVLYDSLVNGVIQRNDTTGAPIEVLAYNPYLSTDRVGARKVHVEDWIALLIFNHLIAGADAFVEAQLWDLPSRVSAFRADDGSMVLAISISVRAPPL